MDMSILFNIFSWKLEKTLGMISVRKKRTIDVENIKGNCHAVSKVRFLSGFCKSPETRSGEMRWSSLIPSLHLSNNSD